MYSFISFLTKIFFIIPSFVLLTHGMEPSPPKEVLPKGFPPELFGHISTFYINPLGKVYTKDEKNFRLVCKAWKEQADKTETQFYEALNRKHGFLPWTDVVEGAIQTPKTIYRSNALLLKALRSQRALLWICKFKPDTQSLYEPYDFFLEAIDKPEFVKYLTRFMDFKIFSKESFVRQLIDFIGCEIYKKYEELSEDQLARLNNELEKAKEILGSTQPKFSSDYYNERIIYYYVLYLKNMFHSKSEQFPSMQTTLESFVTGNGALGKFLESYDEVINLRNQLLDTKRTNSDLDPPLLEKIAEMGDMCLMNDMTFYLLHTKEQRCIDSFKSSCDQEIFSPCAQKIYDSGHFYYSSPGMSGLFLRFSIAALATETIYSGGEKFNKMIVRVGEQFLERNELTNFIHWNTTWMIHAGVLFKRPASNIQSFIEHFITQFLSQNNDHALSYLIESVEACLTQMNHTFRPESYDYMIKCFSNGTIEQKDIAPALAALWTKTSLCSETISLTFEDVMAKAEEAEEVDNFESAVHFMELALQICTDNTERIDCYNRLSQAYNVLGNTKKAEENKIKKLECSLSRYTSLGSDNYDYLIEVYERSRNKDKMAFCQKIRAYSFSGAWGSEMFIFYMEQAIDLSQGKCLDFDDCDHLEDVYLQSGYYDNKVAECKRNRAYAARNFKDDKRFLHYMEKAISLDKGKCLCLNDWTLLVDVCERLGNENQSMVYHKKVEELSKDDSKCVMM